MIYIKWLDQNEERRFHQRKQASQATMHLLWKNIDSLVVISSHYMNYGISIPADCVNLILNAFDGISAKTSESGPVSGPVSFMF